MIHWQCVVVYKMYTCKLSAAGRKEAEQSRCAGNATLPDKEHHTQLVASSVDCDQLLSCTASLSRQIILAHVSTVSITPYDTNNNHTLLPLQYFPFLITTQISSSTTD